MNIYDTANKLADELRKSDEYANYKKAKSVVDSNPDLKEKMTKFEKVRYEAQVETLETGKNNDKKIKEMQNLYAQLIKIDELKEYFNAEIRFNIIIADINKIIGNVIQSLIDQR